MSIKSTARAVQETSSSRTINPTSPIMEKLPNPVQQEVQASSAATAAAADEREQPWKSLIEDIVAEAKKNPREKDFFPCEDGFEAHSLAA